MGLLVAHDAAAQRDKMVSIYLEPDENGTVFFRESMAKLNQLDPKPLLDGEGAGKGWMFVLYPGKYVGYVSQEDIGPGPSVLDGAKAFLRPDPNSPQLAVILDGDVAEVARLEGNWAVVYFQGQAPAYFRSEAQGGAQTVEAPAGPAEPAPTTMAQSRSVSESRTSVTQTASVSGTRSPSASTTQSPSASGSRSASLSSGSGASASVGQVPWTEAGQQTATQSVSSQRSTQYAASPQDGSTTAITTTPVLEEVVMQEAPLPVPVPVPVRTPVPSQTVERYVTGSIQPVTAWDRLFGTDYQYRLLDADGDTSAYLVLDRALVFGPFENYWGKPVEVTGVVKRIPGSVPWEIRASNIRMLR